MSFLTSRSTTDPSPSASDKIGKGLTKLKHGVLGKSMEGVADPLDPGVEVAEAWNHVRVLHIIELGSKK